MADLQEFLDRVREDLDHVEREKREIALLIDQSKAEVDRWAQRQATVTNQLRQVQQHLETVPRNDIKQTYDSALDVQQKLFSMRGQLEKLQSDQKNLDRFRETLRSVLDVLGEAAMGAAGDSSDAKPGGAEAEPIIIRIIEAQEAERHRMSKAMHDGPAQSLTNFVLQAEIVQRLFDANPTQARIELQNLKATATATFQRVREFIMELRPMMLDDLGLIPTVRRYVKAFEEKSGIPTSLTVTGEERRFEQYREVLTFRAIQELLSNVRDHSQATQVRMTLDVDENRVKATVEDNGKGFDAAAVLAAPQENKHLGLRTMKERTELLGGRLDIESAAGQGARATVDLPVGSMNALM